MPKLEPYLSLPLGYGAISQPCTFTIIELDASTRSVWGSVSCSAWDNLDEAGTCALGPSYFFFENCPGQVSETATEGLGGTGGEGGTDGEACTVGEGGRGGTQPDPDTADASIAELDAGSDAGDGG